MEGLLTGIATRRIDLGRVCNLPLMWYRFAYYLGDPTYCQAARSLLREEPAMQCSRRVASLFGATLFLCLSGNAALSRPVGPGDPCAGPALVRAQGGLYGTIYLSDQANAAGANPRRGYLPSNMTIIIDDPPPELKGEFRRKYCHFNYRSVISGYLERNNLIALTGIAKTVGLNIDEMAGFVGPANPEQDKRLRLYRTDGLSDSELIKDLGRNDAAIIFLSAQDPMPDHGVLKVAYIADPDHPAITEAYIRANENRATIGEDGAINFDGTFRVYKPRLNNAYASVVLPELAGSAYEYLQYILKGSATSIKTAIENAENTAKNIGGLKECQKSVTFKLEFSLKSGLGASILSISATGSEEVEWKKPEGKVEQFVHIGGRDDLQLTVHGIVACSDEAPAYLSQANFVIAGAGNAEKGSFTIDRNEFFIMTAGTPIPDNFKDMASVVNLQRPLSQMFVVPRINGEKSPFYYTLFDRIEQYMDQKVFIEPLEISSDDKFALTLLIAQSLGYWQ
jgi:hypothetical protein